MNDPVLPANTAAFLLIFRNTQHNSLHLNSATI